MEQTSVLVLLCTFLCAVVAQDAVVLIRSSAVDVAALKAVGGTYAVYRVKGLHFYANEVYQGKFGGEQEKDRDWNYIILGRGFEGDEAEEWMNKIRGFDFVEDSESTGLKKGHYDANAINKWMKTAENTESRPLKQSNAGWECNDKLVDADDDARILSITFSKYGDEAKLEKYAGWLLMKVFPALDATYVYTGEIDYGTDGSDESEWDAFTVMDFVDKKTWCEYAHSQLLKDNIPQFVGAFQAMGAFTGVEV